MNDAYWLILLNCLASWGNFNTNTEILGEKKKHSVERLLEDILAELVTLNERLSNGDELSR